MVARHSKRQAGKGFVHATGNICGAITSPPAAATRAGGEDRTPGTVLVWRDTDGRPGHAAVALGGGWLLQKSSQGWMSPRQVLDVRQGKYSARFPGLRLSRRRITA